MPNLIEQLQQAPGYWPPSTRYERRGPRFIVTHGDRLVTNRMSERMAEIDFAAAIQQILDAALPDLSPLSEAGADRMGLQVIRECRRFSRAGGEVDLDVYGLRLSLVDAAGKVLVLPTLDVPQIERAIAVAAGQTSAAESLLGDPFEARPTTTPRG